MSKNRKNKRIKTRDYNMVNIIKGVTKAGVHKDRKKEEDKYLARSKVDITDDPRCLQCGFPIDSPEGDREPADYEENGFCSSSCEDYYTE